MSAARRLRRAHSATHLLHAALRRHLGSHVTQKGSLVAPDRLRFDFSHPKPVTPEEQAAIEAEVNAFLRQNAEVRVRLMDREAAIEAGAMALFGEKYGDEVRVVRMGREPDGATTSIELCGGTHCRRTGDIALFKITAESAVAAGVRRIEALTGEAALDHVRHEERLLAEAAGALRVAAAGAARARRDPARRAQAPRAGDLRTSPAARDRRRPGHRRSQGGRRHPLRRAPGGRVPAKDLRGLADAMQRQMGSGVAAVVSVVDGKAAVVVSVSEDLKGSVDAVALVRAGVAELGGKGGGGRADFAQGGGPDGARADAALAAIERGLASQPAAAE